MSMTYRQSGDGSIHCHLVLTAWKLSGEIKLSYRWGFAFRIWITLECLVGNPTSRSETPIVTQLAMEITLLRNLSFPVFCKGVLVGVWLLNCGWSCINIVCSSKSSVAATLKTVKLLQKLLANCKSCLNWSRKNSTEAPAQVMARLSTLPSIELIICLTVIAVITVQLEGRHHPCLVWKKKCDDYDQYCKDHHDKKEMTFCCEAAKHPSNGTGSLGSATQGSTPPSGMYTMNNLHGPFSTSNVFCDMTTDGGGWTVILRRTGDNTSFEQNWEKYEDGFGDLTGSFWYGLKPLYSLTNLQQCELRIDLYNATSSNTSTTYALYRLFKVQRYNYTLEIGNHSGPADDNLSRFDRKPFTIPGPRCKNRKSGGWWYRNDTCSGGAVLTAQYGSDPVKWYFDEISDLRFFPKIEMKIRPINCPS